jgi:hypothetical protein
MTFVLKAILITVPTSVVVIAIFAFFGQRRLGKHRGVSREEFISAFLDGDIPPVIPGAVYDYYKSGVSSKDFSVAPDDDYDHTLFEGEEDIDDDAVFIMKKLAFKRPVDYDSARSEMRIRTLRDMVLWLNWVRQHQSQPTAER